MSEPDLVLDFAMTLDDARVPMTRVGKRIWSEWIRRLVALYLVWMAIDAWHDGLYWSCGIFLFCALFMATPRVLTFWWLFRLLCRNQPPMQIRIQIDQTGLHMHDAIRKTHDCFWWSRLTSVTESEYGYELRFDGATYPSMYIPTHAFADDEQRATFRRLIEEHLLHTAPVNSRKSF